MAKVSALDSMPFSASAKLDAASAPGAPGTAFQTSTESALRVIPNFALSFAHDWFVAGIALNVPYASAVSWPADSALRFETVSSSLRVFRVAPFIGGRYKWFAIAAGPHFEFGSLEVKRATNHIIEEGDVHLLLNGKAYGGQVAIFAEPTPELSLGLSYKSRSTLALDGNVNFNVPAIIAPGFPDQGVSARFKLPDRIALGAAYKFGPARALLDIIYSTWSVNDNLTFDFEKPETTDSVIKNQWRDTVAVRLGGEITPTQVPWLTARAGVFADGLFGPAAPSANLAPNGPDSTRVGGSIGAGFAVSPIVSLDAFYEFFGLLERTSQSSDAPLATYSGSAHIFGLGGRIAYDALAKKQTFTEQR